MEEGGRAASEDWEICVLEMATFALEADPCVIEVAVEFLDMPPERVVD